MIAKADLNTCCRVELKRRDSRVLAFVTTGTDCDVQALVARLDDRLHAVAEAGDHVEPHQALARVGAEPAGCVGELGAGRTVDHAAAELLQRLLSGREVLDQVRPDGRRSRCRPSPSTIGLDKIGDAFLGVLVVAVGVDDDVGAELQRVVDAVLERAGQALVAGVPDEVRDPERSGRPRPSGRWTRHR